MPEKNIMTRAGLKKIEDELEYLRVVKRKEVSEKLKEARAQGDLSENAEYDAAKDEQRDVEARIESLEQLLKNVEVVDSEEITLDSVNVGCHVRVHVKCEAIGMDEDQEYSIVGSTEAASLQGKISNESPIGRALMGKEVGEEATVEVPAGTMVFQILDIQKTEQKTD